MTLSPIAQRRLYLFKKNRRGFFSFWIFLVMFTLSMFAEFIANDRPLIVSYNGGLYCPVIMDYTETTFGGDFPTLTDYRDPYIIEQIESKGWILWTAIRFSYDTINYDLPVPAPAPPSAENWFGTDDLGRDVAARMIYGFRVSVLFGLVLTVISSIIGISAGAVQGYFGGRIDLIFQRFLEVWGSMPQLFILIIVSSIIIPSFWTLLFVLLLFSWTSLVGVVRAEFLRARNLEYVRAARALGMGDFHIMFKHILPNAMVAAMTFLPFILSGSIVALTALDFLGLGLPAGSASLGDLVRQGKENLQAPWLGVSAFAVLASMLILLVFTGEAVRDAFDPRKNVA